jgi:hypothetical protein
MSKFNTTNQYLNGRGQAIFNNAHDAYLEILNITKQCEKDGIEYKYSTKKENLTNKWFIEWKIKNPHYKKTNLFEIEI